MQKPIIGTWPLSGDFGHVPLDVVQKTLATCWDNGFREYDTAPNYGNGFVEFSLGKVFHKKPDALFNSKVGNRPFEGKSFAVTDLQKSVEHSLRRLETDCLNVLFLHNPRTEITDYEPYLEMMSALKKAGKIRFSGISLAKGYAYPDNVIERFDVVQDDVNLLYMDPLFRPYTGKVRLMARSPLASGILGGHITEFSEFAADDQRSQWLKGDRLKSIVKRLNIIKKTSPLPLDQTARRFLLGDVRVNNIIFGVKRPEHVTALAKDLDLKLSPDTAETLIGLYQNDFGLVGEKHLSY